MCDKVNGAWNEKGAKNVLFVQALSDKTYKNDNVDVVTAFIIGSMTLYWINGI